MPNIFDNIEHHLIDALRNVLEKARSCAFCVGYLNLRGWQQIADAMEHLEGGDESRACRVLVGMYRPPEEEMRLLQGLPRQEQTLDGPARVRLSDKIMESFKEQLASGVPSNEAEETLCRLARQLRSGKVYVKAFVRYPLHAKLYLVCREDSVTPLIAFMGSSNLTLAGLQRQGELNVDVVEQDAARKLLAWFDALWNDPLAEPLTEKLAELIENSWASPRPVRPYLIYLKIAYHLSEEAWKEERRFTMPSIFQKMLLDFQQAAVTLVAHKLHRHGGVLLGDVVGLGKTLMATAIARILQEDSGVNTLVICPPKLQAMWDRYLQEYGIVGRTLSLGLVGKELPTLPRYRLVIIDESHNLRNREGKRYRAIQKYIKENNSHVLLLSATPYNKHYTDLSNQLRLFLDENKDLHIRPERYFQWLEQQDGQTETDFIARFQTSPRSLKAFEQSHFPEDWQDLMRLFLVRRTRKFIEQVYAQSDPTGRKYILLHGQPHYFPSRQPRCIRFPIDPSDPKDQYARLFREEVVEVIENLQLPRYGLANYLKPDAPKAASPEEKRILHNLNRAGRQLIGFCRTNLFKRLESSGHSFLLSLQRHIQRNLITLYALEHLLPIPIGTQDVAMLDPAVCDVDIESAVDQESSETESEMAEPVTPSLAPTRDVAARLYERYRQEYADRFDWLDAKFFRPELADALRSDADALHRIWQQAGTWNPETDAKLNELERLLTRRHPREKVLIFTQFADTAKYLYDQLRARGLKDIALLTNMEKNPEMIVRRFSPSTNGGLPPGHSELRVVIATDVLAEGQNLQDAYIVVNYDLPWAIARLFQRAGRVDRIGQKHDTILVYSFLPAEGIERIIRLQQRLVDRLRKNQEVLGADENFFGEQAAQRLYDLYTEKAGSLDDQDHDEDVDLETLALQVWKSASEKDRQEALNLPPLVSATCALADTQQGVSYPPGVVTYLRYSDRTHALIRVDTQGNLVSQSLSAIFKSIACSPETPALPRQPNHHDLVSRCLELAAQQPTRFGGQLGHSRSLRHQLFGRLREYRRQLQTAPTASARLENLQRIIHLIWQYPLTQEAQEAIGRQMRLGISDADLLDLLLHWADRHRLCIFEETPNPPEAEIICSLGLIPPGEKP